MASSALGSASAWASGSSATPSLATKDPKHSDATTASATLPINTRLITGQLAGLVILASAITIAIARLSLRAPKPQDGGAGGTGGTPQ